MYIQVTNRCNFKCAHCCFSCGPFGMDMGRDVFRKAAKLAQEYGEIITLGGGEPTIHPEFWELFGIAMGHTEEPGFMGLITNGSQTEIALQLARMAQSGIIWCELSQDIYHEPIDGKVIQAFQGRTRCTEGNLIDYGRAVSNNLGGNDACPCDELFVDPHGNIWACGHQEAQFGTVDKPEIPEAYWQLDEKCSSNLDFMQKVA